MVVVLFLIYLIATTNALYIVRNNLVYRFVNIYTITPLQLYSRISIDFLYSKFGDAPRYSVLDSTVPLFLFCIDSLIDIRPICEKYSFKYYQLEQILVLDQSYNRNHKIYRIEPNYCLEKVIKMGGG